MRLDPTASASPLRRTGSLEPTYAAGIDPANVEAQHSETTLFAFVAWALVHEPDALADHFAYENEMKEHGFTEFKRLFVNTMIVTAQGIVTA